MKIIARLVVSLLLIAALFSNSLPCGPGYITPLFDVSSAPENPYADYASGRLGIIKPTFHRSVLYAAYRYISGGGLGAMEQKAMVDVWTAEIENKDFHDETVGEAVKAWVEKRKDVVGKEEKTPDVYVERSYGGYDFFPNCTKNAFETATETLGDRISSHGPSDPSVKNWLKAQDQVFQNCSSGKQTPDGVPTGAPDWLQKDRAYQTAAAAFYSLDYNEAKRRFAEIAQDSGSPWAETADYLVARTLIRQASLSKTPEKAAPFYDEAEKHLEKFSSRSGKFSASAERLLGLIKYRRHPKERVSELAKMLSRDGDENFRQNVIDYTWLLDKFESEALTADEKHKQEKEQTKQSNGNSTTTSDQAIRDEILSSLSKLELRAGDIDVTVSSGEVTLTGSVSKDILAEVMKAAQAADVKKIINKLNVGDPERANRPPEDIELHLYSSTDSQNWTFYIQPNATDDEAIAEAEKAVGRPLSDELKKQVREMRQNSYAGRFKDNQTSPYQGNYYGDEKLSPSLLPDFLRQDDLTDWLYTYQMPGNEAYLYSGKKFRESGSELWLMTALSKADKNSAGLPRLIEAANNISRTSPAYPTIAFHLARIMIAQGKVAEGKKLIDEMLNVGDVLPLSARNSFIALKLPLAETLDDFLRYSLQKPWGFDFDGDEGSVDDIIARQKAEYNPEYNTDGREAYEREIDENYKDEKLWQDRLMFDTSTIEVFNQQFSTAALETVIKSPALPDYMHERFVIAIWTRAYLLDDKATMLRITPELIKSHPEFESLLARITNAKTQPAMDRAALFFVLKNPVLSPFIDDGMGKTDNEFGEFDSNDWWCEPYDTEYDDTKNAEVPKQLPPSPPFLTALQGKAAQSERSRLKAIGDAPKFLAAKVMDWAKLAPSDKRVPEAIYIMIGANGWTKYGCGNNEELRDQMKTYLKKRYPNSEWTAKLASEENSNN